MQFLSQHLRALRHDSSQMYQTFPDSLQCTSLMWCYNSQHQLQHETVGSRTMGVNYCGRHLSNLCSYCSHSIPLMSASYTKIPVTLYSHCKKTCFHSACDWESHVHGLSAHSQQFLQTVPRWKPAATKWRTSKSYSGSPSQLHNTQRKIQWTQWHQQQWAMLVLRRICHPTRNYSLYTPPELLLQQWEVQYPWPQIQGWK